MAIDKWRPYLVRGLFVIRLIIRVYAVWLINLSFRTYKKAMTKLIGLWYQVQYKKGADNKATDGLTVGFTQATSVVT